MPRVVSSSEAQNNFGALIQWAEQNREEVVVEKRGKPAVAIISYTEYENLLQLREKERRTKIITEIEELRREVAAANSDLSLEEAYRLAGFSEETIRNMVESDKRLAKAKK